MFKIIKDKIPEILKDEGKECEYAVVQSKNLHLGYLKAKLIEVTNAYLANGIVDDLAELQIVLNSLVKVEGLEKESFESTVETKIEVEGAYDTGYIAFFQDQPQQPQQKEPENK